MTSYVVRSTLRDRAFKRVVGNLLVSDNSSVTNRGLPVTRLYRECVLALVNSPKSKVAGRSLDQQRLSHFEKEIRDMIAPVA
jgi:hypothetical protein